jgi:hypothetical protein
MNCYYDPNYGADADNHRGIPVWDYELGPEDDECVLEQLREQFIDLEPTEIPESAYVNMINPITEDDVELLVYTDVYLDRLR